MSSRISYVAIGGLTAAFYVVFTFVSAMVGLSSGVIQCRISEALCVMPMFNSAAIPGLTIGCFFANLLVGGAFLDGVLGAVATLIGAIGTWLLRNHRWIAPLCPVVSNMLIIPFVLQFVYGIHDLYWFLVLTVGVGEFISAYLLGQLVYSLIIQRNLMSVEE